MSPIVRSPRRLGAYANFRRAFEDLFLNKLTVISLSNVALNDSLTIHIHRRLLAITRDDWQSSVRFNAAVNLIIKLGLPDPV